VGNIILNVHGNTEGKTADFYQASGIYLDNATHDILVKDNLIAGATLGVFLHEGGKNTVDGNTLMDCMLHLLIDREYESSTIINNLVYTTDRRDHSNWWGVNTHQRIIFQNNTSAICNFNTYVVPYIEKDVFANKTDFTHWQTETGQDVNSTYDGTDMKADESEQILYNDTKQTKTFNLGSAVFRDIYGKEISGTLKLEPFTSIILIGKDFSTINQNPHILDQSFHINSPVFDNDTIGKLAANDPDSEQILNYSIIHGDETGWFSIDSTSGVIYFTENFQTSFDLTFEFLVKVSDNAVNSLSDTAFVTVFIEGKDITPPVITSFNIPPLALDLTSPVHSFTATDDIGVTGYLLTESSLVPNINDEWKNEPSEEYTFSGEGTYTIYAWVKDSAGNISNSIADTITVLVPDLSPTFSEYLFEEDSGNTIIDTQGSNDGILFNDVMRVSEGVGSGLKFAGSGYINLGHCFGENVQNEVSMSAWIKPDTSGLGYQGVIMHGGPNTVTFGLFLNPVTKAIDFITNGTTTPTLPIENAEKLWDGNWHHLVAIYNGEEKIIYLDNDVIATIQATGTIDLGYGYNLLIGAGRDETISTLLYKGLLDEVRIYNYAIASAEVGELFHPVNRELNKISTIEDIIICEGEEYLGWTQPGKYKRVLQRFSPFASGADSIVITNLYVNPSYTIYEDVTIYYGENYKEWSESGTYQMTWSSYQGCDSIVVTNLIVEGKKTQYIELEKGWNIFSSYIIPNNMNMEVVMNELRLSNNLVMVQDESENTYEEWNSTDSWINNIGDVKKTDGYKILVNSSSVLEISGREIELPLEIDLKKGVNIITFPFESQIDAIQIFQPLIDQGILEKVQDESGNSLEYWNSIGWLNGIGNLNAGKGYIVHVSNNGTLKIDSISEKSNQTFTANSEPVYFNVDYGGNGFAHMNVNITGLKESGLDVGDEIAIYDGMYCVGAIQLNELNFKMNAVSIPASGSDKIRRIGFYDGNPVDFRIWRKQKNELVNFIPEVVKGELKFNKYSSLFVTFNQVVNLSENIEVYPNPASNFVIIEIPILPQEGVRVFLLDATGQELMSRVIYSNFEKLNVENLSSGLYFLKTYVKDKIFTHKLLIA
jgi:parallel beta-helix repeat protein